MTGAYGLGPFPGTSMSEAADVVLSETGDLPHLPQLPARGLGSDAVGRTAAMLEAVAVDRGPRSWVMTPRPQLLTRATRDRLERDLDECEAAWGTSLERLKVQVTGPWTMGAAIELANGHRVMTDRGALRDLTDALIGGANSHAADVRRRFGAEVSVQLDEPLLADVITGALVGTSELDEIHAVHPKDTGERLAHVVSGLAAADVMLNLTDQRVNWEAAGLSGARTVQLSLDTVIGTADLDGLGQMLSAGQRVGLGVTEAGDEIDELGERPRERAVRLARLFDELGLDRRLLADRVDVHPTRSLAEASVVDAAGAYRMTHVVAGMLERDAGDL